MSAECHDCGGDLAYDLSCPQCDWRAERDTLQAELDGLREAVAAEAERLQVSARDAQSPLSREFFQVTALRLTALLDRKEQGRG